MNLDALRDAVRRAPLRRVLGRVQQVVGPLIEAQLPGAALGALCTVANDQPAEVVGFRGDSALLMPLGQMHGIAHGDVVELRDDELTVPVGDALLGRIVDGLGRPTDGLGEINTSRHRPVHGKPSDPLKRAMLGTPLQTGVRTVDGLLTVARGQRLSIVAGSGVGKSTLLGMLARFSDVDVVVTCLVGERGREVREFVEHNLGEDGLKRAVVVAATSDEPPATQIKAPFTATSIAEYFRDQGLNVLLLVDSLTRLALAQRQIGLTAGEPPTTRGFTPSVFSMLPPLLERAGTNAGDGSITAFYTVLVEGDDPNDPIADVVRGVVDGHIVLSRALAQRNHFPAVDVLKSLSRVAHRMVEPEHAVLAADVRKSMAVWQDSEELIRLGAYKEGTDPSVDRASALQAPLREWLTQGETEFVTAESSVRDLRNLFATG